MIARMQKEMTIKTAAMAVAPSTSYSSNRMTMSCGAISVWNGLFPEIKTIDPYSPTARAKACAKPVTIVGSRVGARIVTNVRSLPAPSVAAASSTSRSRFSRTFPALERAQIAMHFRGRRVTFLRIVRARFDQNVVELQQLFAIWTLA